MGAEYQEHTASRGQLRVVIPVTVALIFLLLHSLYHHLERPAITVAGVLLSAPFGGVMALWLTGSPLSGSCTPSVPGREHPAGDPAGSSEDL